MKDIECLAYELKRKSIEFPDIGIDLVVNKFGFDVSLFIEHSQAYRHSEIASIHLTDESYLVQYSSFSLLSLEESFLHPVYSRIRKKSFVLKEFNKFIKERCFDITNLIHFH